MTWADFANKKVGLLGAGIENIALIPHLLKAGARVTVCNQVETAATDQLKDQGVELAVGEDYLNNLGQFDYVFRIAGMPTAAVDEALKGLDKKPAVTSPTDLFLALRPCHLIGVTGTKGKGTTSTFIGCILEAAGKKVFVVGNIGRAMFEIYNELTPESYVVVELSSFQLEDVTNSPEIAVVLPVTEDHLQPVSTVNPNFHPTVLHYQAAKANITAFQNPTDLLVYAADSKTAAEIARDSSARQISVGTKLADLIVSPTGEIRADEKVLLNLKQMGLSGDHIFLNATIAVAVAREIGCDSAEIEQGLRNFQPLPHRMETFATRDGVTFVDDSYATNPTATMAALTAFTQPIILILGGASIGADFKELAEAVTNSSVKTIVLIGQEAARLRENLQAAGFGGNVTDATLIDDAVEKAIQASSSGDVVLLSPACKSFDMFKNASDRGEQFKRAVSKHD
ncbi:UDP-N-acetylmuramoylalanine--D-glutamate ligase [Candidatus Berkelbacteria bacterium RIFCSPLOWO2_01_FULL_50_28]|uniref:UDP-N-acetylmuramoylalanine--D-glutamate ligase n=1 Tax=Candidatus Berkelbacteria bacterium RIFCSPLOWO2_01_FULL_50_28 TaxID=1797471 RepID=A0A1F5EBF9_9BACT|nr:MAG: UDP-N-acetylmuramoylalanine--D-glutamate ligase [Candidatus Berkelbacteria bacterium RIFCSPHIGHO2_12_FULL_50_11]OGD64752.1 MAG: UDP-N-acetylmuramoylalanine--D-glutamate ligase [Candidatus Berkelbacteria bacterium RIFCSPLOWO2_01_FULL_50_28]